MEVVEFELGGCFLVLEVTIVQKYKEEDLQLTVAGVVYRLDDLLFYFVILLVLLIFVEDGFRLLVVLSEHCMGQFFAYF